MAVRAISEAVVIAVISTTACATSKAASRRPYVPPPHYCSEGLPAPEAARSASDDSQPGRLENDPSVKDYVRRLKEAARAIWIPKVERLGYQKDPRGRCLCSQRRAVVEFTIDRSGSILPSRIVRSSQVRFVDQSALETMNEIGQVKDPPTSIFGDQPTVKLAFGFVLALDQRFEPRSCDPLANPHESILRY